MAAVFGISGHLHRLLEWVIIDEVTGKGMSGPPLPIITKKLID